MKVVVNVVIVQLRIARIMLAEKNLFEHVRLFVKCVESFEAAWRQKNT